MYTGRKYYFITIAETLNITQAARQLMVSQPSLTQYLNKLEKDMELHASEYARLTELSGEKERTQAALDEKMERWMYLEELAAKIAAQ